MNLKIGVYYAEEGAAAAEFACKFISEVFPGVSAELLTSMEVPAFAMDTSTGRYDVQALLDEIAVPADCDAAVWIVTLEIGDFWQGGLFGAAVGDRAVVSSAGLDSMESLAKELCHEIGHLLGLSHCPDDCCMQLAGSVEAVQRKPMKICSRCREVCMCL